MEFNEDIDDDKCAAHTIQVTVEFLTQWTNDNVVEGVYDTKRQIIKRDIKILINEQLNQKLQKIR